MSKLESKKWEDILTIINGKSQAKVINEKGQYPIYGSGGIMGYADDYICNEDTVIIGRKGNINKPIFVPTKFWNVDTAFGLQANKDLLIPKYLYYFCIKFNFEKLNTTVTIPSLTKRNLLNVIMPVPPLETQKHIAKILDKVSEIINLHNKRLEELDNLTRTIFYDMFGDPVSNEKGWEKKKLSEVCEIVTGNTPPRNNKSNYGEYIEWIKSDNITNQNTYLTEAVEYLSENGLKIGRSVDKDTILMTCIAGSIRCIGNVAIANRKVSFNQQINAIIPLKNNVYYLYVLFLQTQKYIQSTINMSLKGILSKGKLSSLEFIMPPIELQNRFAQIVTKIEEQKILEKQAIGESQNLFNSLMSRYFD